MSAVAMEEATLAIIALRASALGLAPIKGWRTCWVAMD